MYFKMGPTSLRHGGTHSNSSLARHSHYQPSRRTRLMSKFSSIGPRFRRHITFANDDNIERIDNTYAGHEYDRTSVRTHLKDFDDFKRCIVDVIIYKKEEMNLTLDPNWYQSAAGKGFSGRKISNVDISRSPLTTGVGQNSKLNILAASTPRDDVDIERVGYVSMR
ncbi:hypothetical protein SARC_06844 [Sphaeroforma arctica JP610]|uniref:Uncharacterized protein n=1 Tax=Sphaeroforma arctica JP610 TaxID=667725 RepID=A0A0L0FVE4_9EUKA|nr:hypothetical protein SARC_06844 [Sphaeroforma arctica JP610]KNC80807.1 hypothetical protein SARC_06844 [Sphaeroforma arctica JP610]|eukprot:XP_014154709.1 hypothetical protein SARC_06844 [Sphaeroforma arctica JP610]